MWPNGTPVKDSDILERITGLAVPPAWNDVWICPWPHGHIQAVGTDKAGRRQYRYHDAWRVLRDKQKFERVLEFGRSLPVLRRAVERDLGDEAITQSRVLAATVRLLDLGFFRIGGEQYAQENETFGIATLRREHLAIRRGKELVFDYPAKGSIQRKITISDPASTELLQILKRRRSRSDKLMAYKDGTRWVDLRSNDINAYIRTELDGDYSAKDFRTWSATVLGAVELARAARRGPMSASARKKASRLAVKADSEDLGNTPAVCRSSYIDPKLFDRFDAGETIASALNTVGTSPAMNKPAAREAIESAVSDLIADEGPGGLIAVA